MSNDGLKDLLLPLDERNLAHVLSAVALAALASRDPEARPSESTCWWSQGGFIVRTAITDAALFGAAHRFLQRMRWIPGFGAAEQGTFAADSEIGSNPFISLAEGGQEKSPFKTFSGQQGPGDLLEGQKGSLAGATVGSSWLVQPERGIASWGFDCRVGSHAYDLGFSSNDEGTGDRDPVYTAVEMLSIAGASFFTAIQGWQLDADSVNYSIWTEPISVTLVRYAVAGRLDGLPAKRYRARSRGGAYGKGAAYRFFPEATLQNQKGGQ
ncbi:MAG TPA: hypothetical protein VN924_29200 [Bryobacteraceae bacterium]|nr:hypothetical protein [Bryobacteraceae bacterium]